jgi:hypothetical protein
VKISGTSDALDIFGEEVAPFKLFQEGSFDARSREGDNPTSCFTGFGVDYEGLKIRHAYRVLVSTRALDIFRKSTIPT